MLVAEADGRLREPFKRVGALTVTAPVARRRRRSAIKKRRPTLPLRRVTGVMPATPVLHRDEREIIARH
jgi:hypothetical protein